MDAHLGARSAQWLIVSKVSHVDTALDAVMGFEVAVEKNEGHICPRCWNIVDTVSDAGLCDRCCDVLKDSL